MKRNILILVTMLLPVISVGQNRPQGTNEEEVTISILVSGIDRAFGKVADLGKGIASDTAKELKQFADEIPQEKKDEMRNRIQTEVKIVKKTGRYILDCIHAGWSSGWRGEEYVRPYDLNKE